MNHDLFYLFFFGNIFLILLIITEIFYVRFSFSAELTRKIIHLTSGTVSSFFIIIFDKEITAVLMALIFFLLVIISKKAGFLKSVHSVHRKSIGGFIFPLSICLLFILTRVIKLPDYSYFSSVMVLSLSDPMASFGGFINYKLNRNTKGVIMRSSSAIKTLLGSFFYFFTAVPVLFFTFIYMTTFTIFWMLIMVFVISLAATITELFSFRGWDNLTCPLVVWVFIFLIEKVIV